ncbi:hypothetical protein [Paraburkholderia sp. SIMBA_030]
MEAAATSVAIASHRIAAPGRRVLIAAKHEVREFFGELFEVG